MGGQPIHNAYFTCPGSSTQSSGHITSISSAPCVWCNSKGCTEVAKGHSLQVCTFAASLDHNRKNAASGSSTSNKTRPFSKQPGAQNAKQAQETVTEFAGTASQSLPTNSTPSDRFWVTDSGATSSMTPHLEWIHDLRPWHVPIRLGDNSIIYSEGIGKVWFEPVLAGHPAPLICLSHVLYVPRLKSNLLSITFLSTQRNYEVSFLGHTISFKRQGQLQFDASTNSNRVGKLNGRTMPAISVPDHALYFALAAQDLELWHKRFGPRNVRSVAQAIKNSVVGATITSDSIPPSICVPCLAGKQQAASFPFPSF